MTHPFWEGALSSLAVELENPPEEINTLRQSIRQSVLSTVRASTQSETLNTNSVLGQVHHLDVGGYSVHTLLFVPPPLF